MRVAVRRDSEKWDGRPCKRAGEHNDAGRTFRSYLDVQAGMAIDVWSESQWIRSRHERVRRAECFFFPVVVVVVESR